MTLFPHPKAQTLAIGLRSNSGRIPNSFRVYPQHLVHDIEQQELDPS